MRAWGPLQVQAKTGPEAIRVAIGSETSASRCLDMIYFYLLDFENCQIPRIFPSMTVLIPNLRFSASGCDRRTFLAGQFPIPCILARKFRSRFASTSRFFSSKILLKDYHYALDNCALSSLNPPRLTPRADRTL